MTEVPISQTLTYRLRLRMAKYNGIFYLPYHPTGTGLKKKKVLKKSIKPAKEFK